MFNKFILCAAVGLCLTGNVRAQQACGTDEHHREMLIQFPELASFEAQLEAEINNKLARTTATNPNDTTTLDMAVVVHVVHDYGAEWVSDNTIYTAVKNWTTVFMCQNSADTATVIAPFKKWIGNAKFRLHLATKDPSGNPTKGVVRHNSYWTLKAGDQAKFESWDQTRYINIWLINAFGGNMTGTAAYAQYPQTAAFQPYYDGVISLYTYVDYENTINHEIGHCMNLQHVWGNNNSAAVACGNDQVDDTPPTKGHSPTGCSAAALYDTTCATGYLKHYTGAGGSDSVVDYPDTVNAQNIMDYTYCSRMFTKGQVARMRASASLGGTTAGRSTLYTQATIASTGSMAPFPDLPPVAEYSVNKASGTSFVTDSRTYFLTANNTSLFNFKNWSWNDTITSVEWTFSNGASTPISTSIGSVTTSFSQPGWATVTLKATSNAGTTTLTNTHAVFVADTIGQTIGSVQEFSAPGSMDKWPMINAYNNRFLWEQYHGVGYSDTTCVRFKSYDVSDKRTGDPIGDHDEFYTPGYDLSGFNKAYLNYYSAGAYITGNSGTRGDSMVVEASVTGGQRWTKIATHYASDLANNGAKAGEFIPTATNQWKARTDTIPAALCSKNTFIRFHIYAGNKANNLYIDKVSVDQWTVDVKEAMASSKPFSIFPNPATNGFNLVFNTGNEGVVNYSIRDIAGKLVYQHTATFAPNTTQQENISRAVTPAAGMYLIAVTVDGVTTTQKLVVY